VRRAGECSNPYGRVFVVPLKKPSPADEKALA
jgi:hypothetical protein